MTIGDCLLNYHENRNAYWNLPPFSPLWNLRVLFSTGAGHFAGSGGMMAWWQTRAEVIIMRDFPRFHTLNSAGVFFRGVDHCGLPCFTTKKPRGFGGFWWGFEGPHVLARWKWRAFFQLQHIKWYISANWTEENINFHICRTFMDNSLTRK